MSRTEHAPIVGQPVHFFELRGGTTFGPLAATVTNIPSCEWRVNTECSVDLAVLGEGSLRFVPDVPFDDGGEYAGCFWKWPSVVEEIVQSGC